MGESIQRLDKAMEGRVNVINLIREISLEWDGLTDFMKENVIGAICINLSACDCFTQVTQEFVEGIFREAGWGDIDDVAIRDVIARLKRWGSIS